METLSETPNKHVCVHDKQKYRQVFVFRENKMYYFVVLKIIYFKFVALDAEREQSHRVFRSLLTQNRYSTVHSRLILSFSS